MDLLLRENVMYLNPTTGGRYVTCLVKPAAQVLVTCNRVFSVADVNRLENLLFFTVSCCGWHLINEKKKFESPHLNTEGKKKSWRSAGLTGPVWVCM